MEVFNFMPYTYYTRMTGGGGRPERNAGSFLRKELGDRAAVWFSIRLAFPNSHDRTG